MKGLMGVRDGDTFRIQQTIDEDGTVRLALSGELDLATSPAVEWHLSRLRARGEHVRLDLSKLEFIDARGVRSVTAGVGEAGDPWQLEIDPNIPPRVSRLFALIGLDVSRPKAA